ncbi:MAG: AAA family ATPase, partial [Bacteroidia bacterium]
KIDMPSGLREDVLQDLTNRTSEKTKVFLSDPRNDKYYVISKVEDGIGAQVLKTKHKKADGSYILFDIKDESDGTRRIMDLIPFVLDFFKGENVFVIDEIERSLHPNLVRDLFELLLEKCDGINSQLIVSSHEATLLNQNVFRKDEIWFALKNKQGATQLLSLEDYNVRYDKDIMKDYLLGRYRAVPQLGNRDALTVLPNTKTQNA